MCSLDASGDAKETMYGIEKKYGVSGEDLREPIHLLKKALQIDKPSRVKKQNKYSCSSR
jgi:hypothetical protein